MTEEAILADLAARYPDGARYFTQNMARRPEPQIELTHGGLYRVNVNGYYHLYDATGAFLSNDTCGNLRIARPTAKVKRVAA